MSRRGLTLLLAGLLAFGLTAGAAVARVPYVALGPGPVYDTLGQVGGRPVIEIEGRRTYPTTGTLDLTTVGVVPRLTLVEALQGWLDDQLAVVPRTVVYPPGQSDDQVDSANTQAMTLSQDNATTAALRQLGIPVSTEVAVRAVTDGAPAAGKLQAGDVIRSVDGQPVRDSTALRDRVSARAPGQQVTLSYVREGRPGSVTLTTVGAEGDASRAVIGVEPQDRADYPFDVTIHLKDVGGPSAGLMFALGIVDKLDPQPLTGGAKVAGTGAISADGRVGPIGGIPQKLLAASRRGATVFLTPAGNCAEAQRTAPEGLQLVRVATLNDALVGLRALRDGGTPTGCGSASASS